MNKKTIKILTIIIIILMFSTYILKIYASDTTITFENYVPEPNYEKNYKPPIWYTIQSIEAIVNLSSMLLSVIAIIPILYLLIKYKDKKSFKIWAICFIIIWTLIGVDGIAKPGYGMRYSEYQMKIMLVIRMIASCINLVSQIFIMIYPIIKIIKYKISDKISKGEEENVRND